GGNGDIHVAAGAVESLLKGQIGDQLVDVLDNRIAVDLFVTTVPQPAHQAGFIPRRGNQVVRIKILRQGRGVVGARHGGKQGPGAGAGNNIGQQILLHQGFQHPDMEIAEGGATAEHQGGTTKAVAGALKKIQALLEADLLTVQIRQVVQGVGDLLDVVLDQVLGAE